MDFTELGGLAGILAALGGAVWVAWQQLSPKMIEKRERDEASEEKVRDMVSDHLKDTEQRLSKALQRVTDLEKENDEIRDRAIRAENANAVLTRRLLTLGREDLTEFTDDDLNILAEENPLG